MLTFLFSVMTLLLEGSGKLVSSHRVLHHSDGDNPIHQHHHRHHHRGLKVDGITNNGNDEASPIHGGLCGTIDMPEKEMELVQRNMDLYLKTVPDASRIFQTSVTIDVSFHVIYNGATGAGFVSDSRITDQIQALNDAFESHGFQFNLRDITKTNNRQWYTNCRTNFDFKRALRDPNDGLDVMYFYTCLPIDADGDEILGYATFPFANPPAVSIDGVVCDGDTLPRGPLLSYDEGKVAVHEVGHWLGLYHTFQGSCSGGDFIADTPAEAEPAFGCPFGRDTCSSPGVDPINNYMDYTDDYCSTEFSPGQTARMQALWNIYRSAAPKPPTIVLSDGVPLTGQNLVTGASQEYELRNVAIDSLVLIELSGDNGNADLYTGTCSSTETDSNESCTNVAKVDNDSIQATVFATTDVMELTITATVTPPPLPIELQLDAAVAGQSAATDTLQRYFVTDVAAGTALVISLSGLSGDADLYVGIGYLPTIDTSDCASQGATSSELCILVVTEPSTVNILVSAFRGYTGLTVLAREDVATELQFGVALNGQNAATETELRFYVANVDAGSTLTIDVAGPNGDADLYIGFDYGPTTTVYDCASESSNSFETCSFTVAEMSTVNILVYAFTGYTGLTVLATTDGLPVAPDSSPSSEAPVPAFSSDAPVTAQSSEAPTSAPSSDKEDECGLFGNSIFCPLLFRGVFARFFRNFLDLF